MPEKPESLLELVERCRSFVGGVSAAFDNIVLIGIDELDEFASARQA